MTIKIIVCSDSAKAFIEAMVDKANQFGWESLVNTIRIDGAK